MNNLYARSVFFVKNAERAWRFYTESLGFAEDWNYREEGGTYVCQVSLFGFELILNEMAIGRKVGLATDESLSGSMTIRASRCASILQHGASRLSAMIGDDRRLWSGTWTPMRSSSGCLGMTLRTSG
jgi:hypothetical protein